MHTSHCCRGHCCYSSALDRSHARKGHQFLLWKDTDEAIIVKNEMCICRLHCFGKVLCSWDLLKAHLIYCSSTTSIEPRLVSSLHPQSPLSLSLIPLSLSLGIKSSQVGYGGHDRALSWYGCPWLLYSQLGSTSSARSGNIIVTYLNA